MPAAAPDMRGRGTPNACRQKGASRRSRLAAERAESESDAAKPRREAGEAGRTTRQQVDANSGWQGVKDGGWR